MPILEQEFYLVIHIGIRIRLLMGVVCLLAGSAVGPSGQPLPRQIREVKPNASVKAKRPLSAATVGLFKELGIQTDTLGSSRDGGHKDIERVRAWIKKGADVNAVSLAGFTPLWLAADLDQADLVNFLLDHGAKIDGQGPLQETPLNRATEVGQVSMVKLLLKRGANTDIPNRNGFTPLIAAQVAGEIDILKILLAHHANVNIRDFTPDHKTVLGYARTLKPIHPEIIELLRKQGAKE